MTYYLNGPLPLMTACLAMVSMVTMGFLELRTLMIPNKSSLGVSPDTKISNWFDNGTQFLDLLTLYTHKYIKKRHTHTYTIQYNFYYPENFHQENPCRLSRSSSPLYWQQVPSRMGKDHSGPFR